MRHAPNFFIIEKSFITPEHPTRASIKKPSVLKRIEEAAKIAVYTFSINGD